MTSNPRLQSAPLAPYLDTIHADDISLSDLLDTIESRFDLIEPDIQSFVPEIGRFDRLRREAQALDTQYPTPDSRPPLFGVLVGIKDIFHVDGFVTRAGTQVPPDLFAGKQAAVVTKLKQAGALIVGKTVTTEFAYFEPGPTRNPHHLDHTPGGSSSGSAAAVASGLVHLTTGTQTVGSVIRPAAYCGIVGYKPSFNRIDTAGLVYFSRSADHVGLFTQDADGMLQVASALVNDWRNQRPAQRPILAVPEGNYLRQSTALEAFEQHIQQLQDAGYEIQRIPVFDDIDQIDVFHQTMIAAELAQEHADWFPDHANLYRQRTADLIRYGQTISTEQLEAGRASRMQLRQRLHDIMDEHGIDLWISPPAPDVAPVGIHATGSPAMNMPWTHSGLPSVTIPAGYGDQNLPFGIQLCARYGADESLLAWSPAIEAVYKSL